ncbi:hypothetical protein Tco_0865601, partial [Tanacetum coccineum]
YPEAFSSITDAYGNVLIPEGCSQRKFNLTYGKVCILTDRLNFIKEFLTIPFKKEYLSVRVEEVEGDIDSLFNGCVFSTDSEDESGSESKKTKPWKNKPKEFSGNEANLVDDSSGEDLNTDDESDKDVEKDNSDVFFKNSHIGDIGRHVSHSNFANRSCSSDGSTSCLGVQVNDKTSTSPRSAKVCGSPVPTELLSEDIHQNDPYISKSTPPTSGPGASIPPQ